MNRRTTLQGLGAMGLMGAGAGVGGCRVGEDAARLAAAEQLRSPGRGRLYTTPERRTPSLPEGAAARFGDVRVSALGTAGATEGRWDRRDFGLDTPFRVASVSKVLVAELARRLAARGLLSMDADAGEALGTPLRHPGDPNTPITLRQLLSHRSGIRDPDVYWMAAPGDIRALFVPQMWGPGARPGVSFRYSNLNYGIAATVMEAATGERFDRLFTREIAQPLGRDIGFNWSGVSAAKRASAFPGVRGADSVLGTGWEVQVDGAGILASDRPAILAEDGFDLADYVPGTNGTLFSPQGGLRASLYDLVEIGREIILPQTALHAPTWVWNGDLREDGPSEEGHFVAFGEGLYIYPGSEPFGAPAVGHHGEAYGIHCGVFVLPGTGEVFAYADLGSSPKGAPMTGGVPNLPQPAAEAAAWMREVG